MIINNLSTLLGKCRMTQSELAKKTGIRPATINELYHDIARGISFEQLDRLCEVLNCTTSDLFEYTPNAMKKTGKSLILEDHGNRKKHQ